MKALALLPGIIVAGCCSFLPCDPGWSYTAPSGKRASDGWYQLSGPERTTVRSTAHLFTSSLSVAFEITNDAEPALTIVPEQLRVFDSQGTALAPDDSSRAYRCDGRPSDSSVSLRRGQTCVIRTGWRVQPDPKRLGAIRIRHDGISREGAPVPLEVALKAKI